jgi:hypothetical protein
MHLIFLGIVAYQLYLSGGKGNVPPMNVLHKMTKGKREEFFFNKPRTRPAAVAEVVVAVVVAAAADDKHS